MRTSKLLAIVCAASLAPAIGAAEPAPVAPPAAVRQARQQVTAADIDYRLGRFADALDKYTRAYELYPVPELLFNIAQCHKNLKQFAKAIFFYEGYLRDAPNAANRELVHDLIRESNAELAQATPHEAPPPSDEAPPQPIEAAPQPAPALAPARIVVPEAPPHRRFLVLSAAMLGGGIAAVAGGGVFYYYGQKRGPHEMFVYDDTRWLGGAMMALGGAAIATGIVLWLRGAPRASGPVAVAVPGGGSLGWQGAF